MGFTKKNVTEIYIRSLKVIFILGTLPLIYNGNMQVVDNFLENIKYKYYRFNNIIENYFKPEKYKYFINGELNYWRKQKVCL